MNVTFGSNLGRGSNTGESDQDRARLYLSGTNSYLGGTTVSGGVLQAASPAALPNYNTAGQVTVGNGATLAIATAGTGWQSANLGSLLTANSGGFSGGSNLGLDTTNGNFSYAGAISGNMGLIKLGGNTLTLSGSNNYSVSTAINGGTLQLGNAAALSSGSLTANSGVLDLTPIRSASPL